MGEALRDGGLKNLLRLLKRKIAGTPGTNGKKLGTVRASGPLGAGDKPGTSRGLAGDKWGIYYIVKKITHIYILCSSFLRVS